MSTHDTTLSKSQFIKVKDYRVRYGLQHGALSHTKQQAIKCPQKDTSVKPFKREKQWSYLYKKREMRNTYEPHQQMTTTGIRFLTWDKCKQLQRVYTFQWYQTVTLIYTIA